MWIQTAGSRAQNEKKRMKGLRFKNEDADTGS